MVLNLLNNSVIRLPKVYLKHIKKFWSVPIFYVNCTFNLLTQKYIVSRFASDYTKFYGTIFVENFELMNNSKPHHSIFLVLLDFSDTLKRREKIDVSTQTLI